MYCKHFKLKQRPFIHPPGQRFFTANASVTDALTRLGLLLTARDAVAVLTGGPGVGKTALVEMALASAPEGTRVARVDLRYGEADDIYASILAALGEDAADARPALALAALRRTMARLVRDEQRLLLCLDIGGISTEIARHLLRIINLAGEHDCQMNVVLMGPHPLHQQVDVPALIQLRQRIGFRYRVRPLTLQETDRYVRHQVEAVGADFTVLMSSSVCAAVYCYVAGVPRLINTLMDAALSEGCLQNLERPDGNLVKRTAEGLGWKPMTPRQPGAEPGSRPASPAPRPAPVRSSPPRVSIVSSSGHGGDRPRGAGSNKEAGTDNHPMDLPPPSEMTMQLRGNGKSFGEPGGNVSLAAESRSPTAAIFGEAKTQAPSGVPPMDEVDTSATGMLRLQDLDERFAESIFGKEPGSAPGKSGD